MRKPFCVMAFVVLLFSTVCTRCEESKDMRRRKKLIATGWDKPDTVRLLENLEQMEKRPFDGVVIVCYGQIDENKRCYMRGTFKNEEWKREWLRWGWWL